MAPYLLLAGVALVVAGVALLWGLPVATLTAGILLVLTAVAVAVVEERRRTMASPS